MHKNNRDILHAHNAQNVKKNKLKSILRKKERKKRRKKIKIHTQIQRREEEFTKIMEHFSKDYQLGVVTCKGKK